MHWTTRKHFKWSRENDLNPMYVHQVVDDDGLWLDTTVTTTKLKKRGRRGRRGEQWSLSRDDRVSMPLIDEWRSCSSSFHCEIFRTLNKSVLRLYNLFIHLSLLYLFYRCLLASQLACLLVTVGGSFSFNSRTHAFISSSSSCLPERQRQSIISAFHFQGNCFCMWFSVEAF